MIVFKIFLVTWGCIDGEFYDRCLSAIWFHSVLAWPFHQTLITCFLSSTSSWMLVLSIISRKTGLFSVTTTDSMWVLLRIPKYLIFLLDLVLKAHIYLNFVLVLSILVTMKFVYFAAVTHNWIWVVLKITKYFIFHFNLVFKTHIWIFNDLRTFKFQFM